MGYMDERLDELPLAIHIRELRDCRSADIPVVEAIPQTRRGTN